MNKKQQQHAASIARRLIRAKARAKAANAKAAALQAALNAIVEAENAAAGVELEKVTDKTERGFFEAAGVRFWTETTQRHDNPRPARDYEVTRHYVELIA